MSNIGTSTVGNINLNPLLNQEPIEKAKATGLGSIGQGGIVPTGTLAGSQTSQTFASAKMSLSAFMSNGPAMDTDVLLVQVAVSLRDTEATSQKAKINTDQEAKKAQSKEKEFKLEEAQKKMEEAERKKSGGSLIDKIKMAFDVLAAVLSIVAAVLLIATGAGTVAGIGLLGSAAVATVMAVDSIVTATTGKGIAANIHLLINPGDEEGAAKADMGFRISMAAIGMAFAVVSMGTGAANAASAVAAAGSAGARAGMNAAQTGATVGKVAKETAMAFKDTLQAGTTLGKSGEQAASTGTKVSQAITEAITKSFNMSADAVDKGMKMGKIVNAVSDSTQQVARVGLDAGTITLKTQSTLVTADAKKLEAAAKADEAVMQMLDDMIDQAIARLIASGDRFASMLAGITDSMQDRGDTLSRAQFRG